MISGIRGHGKHQGKPVSYSECEFCTVHGGEIEETLLRTNLFTKPLKQPITVKLYRRGNMP